MIQSNFSKGDYLTDDEAMDLAIEEAKKGAGRVAPNPLVGCVVLSADHRLLAKGHHEKYGGPHAEINALKGLKTEQLKGARLFVTLEPCAHEGKTPSCAKHLATLPIYSVTYGLTDPNPLVSGQGAAIIESAGIKAILYDHKKNELEEVCEVFLKNHRDQKAFVSLKVATSVDGILALNTGESKWITGEAARTETHFLRACHDAILIGASTLRIDNPQLDIRHPQFSDKTNKVIILDPQAESLVSLASRKFMQCHKSEDVFIIVSEQGTEEHIDDFMVNSNLGINIVKAKPLMASIENQLTVVKDKKSLSLLDLQDALKQLWNFGIRSILVEGGAFTHSEFIHQKCADRLYQFIAPKIIGGGNGKTWTSQLMIPDLSQAYQLNAMKMKQLGSDFLLTGRFE